MIHQKSPKQSITGIVLSGGYSIRFQKENEPWRDKALMLFNGEVILQKTIRTLSNFCDKIIVMVKFEDRKSIYHSYIDKLSVDIKSKVIIAKDNNQFLCNGPTLGIVSSLDFIESAFAIVVPVDLPLLDERILTDLLSQLNSNSMVVPYWHNTGKIEPLVFAFKIKPVQALAKILSQIKRSRADDLHRAILNITFLALSSSKLEEIDNIFTSLNERSKAVELSKTKEFEAGDFFDLINSKIISEQVNNDLLNQVENFLLRYNFIKPLKEILSQIMELSKKLIQQKMFFIAGIFLFNFISKFTCKEMKSKKGIQIQLIELCLYSFRKEASQWHNSGIQFLELHTLSDAVAITKMFNLPSQKELEKEILKLKELLDLKKKKHDEYNLDTLLERNIPSFLDQAMKMIQESEKSFNEETPTFTTNFLWDHSIRVGKIAYKLALEEGVDPLVPTIAAILHDAGKFVLGKYHSDDVIEEEHSSTIAQKLLENSDLQKRDIEAIKTAINALYNEKLDCNINCKIVHDADRLEKLGPLGIANFFTKMTLRGVNLSNSILKNLSRELTYIAAAPKTLHTETGKQLAQTRSQKALLYFDELLEEFAFYDLGKFHVKEFEIEKDQKVTIVIPEKCQKCNGEFTIQLSKEMGIKCEKAKVEYSCTLCDQKYKTEFCLPLIYGKN
ncbi:MAG: NTP transferase domain-containing protein [Candidatus Heimdallarchaeota archaeon]|nr:NTP transferase domain-containing protein [Candidatus Heimdallarchaeota archaeon]MBY8993411.1 NTP transferase domain-containing protein [Candidatus Heimdallarchaeota archaeon]